MRRFFKIRVPEELYIARLSQVEDFRANMYLNSEVYPIYFSNLRLRMDGVRGACMVFQDFEFRAESE
jgi:hypothetical protein